MYTSGWSYSPCQPNNNEKQLSGADVRHCGRLPVPQTGPVVCCGVFKCTIPDSAPDGQCTQKG